MSNRVISKYGLSEMYQVIVNAPAKEPLLTGSFWNQDAILWLSRVMPVAWINAS